MSKHVSLGFGEIQVETLGEICLTEMNCSHWYAMEASNMSAFNIKILQFIALLICCVFTGCVSKTPTPDLNAIKTLHDADVLRGSVEIRLINQTLEQPYYLVTRGSQYNWKIPAIIDPYKYEGQLNNSQKLEIVYEQIKSDTHQIVAINEGAAGDDTVTSLLFIKGEKAELFAVKDAFRKLKRLPKTYYRDTEGNRHLVKGSGESSEPMFLYFWKISAIKNDGVAMESNQVFYQWKNLSLERLGSYQATRESL